MEKSDEKNSMLKGKQNNSLNNDSHNGQENDLINNFRLGNGFGHQLVSLVIDQQFQYLLSSTLQQTIETFTRNPVSKEASNYLVDTLYTIFSLENEFSSFFIEKVLRLPVENDEDVTPGMKAMGLGWDQRGSTVILLILKAANEAFQALWKIAFQEGWAMDDETIWKRHTYKLVRNVIFYGKMFSMINFVTFLFRGDYPTLLHRIAGFRMKLDSNQNLRFNSSQLSLENRKMVWYVMMGLITALAITFDWNSLRYYFYFYSRHLIQQFTKVKNLLRKGVFTLLRRNPSTLSSDSLDDKSLSFQRRRQYPYNDLIPDDEEEVDDLLSRDRKPIHCGLCNLSPPQIPYVSKCGHMFCYYCYFQLLPNPQEQHHQHHELNLTDMDEITRFGENSVSTRQPDNASTPKNTGMNNEENFFYCPQCYYKITSCRPWTADDVPRFTT